ncbi:MAG: hypothetical protein V8T87_11585 [Victivallales bacterium]
MKAAAEKTVRKAVKSAPVKAPARKAAVKTPAEEVHHEHEHPVRKLKLSKVDKKYFRELLMHARDSFGEQIQAMWTRLFPPEKTLLENVQAWQLIWRTSAAIISGMISSSGFLPMRSMCWK